MKDKLADLVLPGNRPIEDFDDSRPLPGMHSKPAKRGGVRLSGLGDWAIVCGGLALAIACALFPWYIFFNQEKFGIRPLRFEGRGTVSAQPLSAIGPDLVGIRFPGDGLPLELDQLATGTASADEQQGGVPLSEQPFPVPEKAFTVVHVANGRALIEDDTGFWIVRRGSWLPDGSRVAAIEERGGQWALVTSLDTVVPLTP